MLGRKSKQQRDNESLHNVLSEYLRNSSDFVVRDGKKYFSAKVLQAILEEHRQKLTDMKQRESVWPGQ